jgi:hypothetical protein
MAHKARMDGIYRYRMRMFRTLIKAMPQRMTAEDLLVGLSKAYNMGCHATYQRLVKQGLHQPNAKDAA